MLCLVRYLFVVSTSLIDCLGRFVPEMTYYVSSGTLNPVIELLNLNLNLCHAGPHYVTIRSLVPVPTLSQIGVKAWYVIS